MKIAKFSIVRRKSVAVLLTVCVLAATFVGIVPMTASAATLATIGNHAIGSDDFETNMLATDWTKVATTGFNADVSGGKLVLSHTNSSGSSFNAMLLRSETAINQRVRLDWVIQGDINPEVWARVQTDSTGKVTGGYFVRFVSPTANSSSGMVNNAYAMLYKLTTENGTRKVTALAKLGTVDYEKDTATSVELVVTGTNPTVVTAVMYKNNSFAHKNVVIDDSTQLQKAGTAGLTYQKASGKSVADTFSADNFEYTTTDNETGEYYQSGQKGTIWHNANTTSQFAQVLVLDPSKTYVFEAIGSTSNTKSIFADYETTENKSSSFFADDELPTVTVSDDGYNLYRYELNFPANAKRNSNFYHSEGGQNVNYTRVRVGYTRGSSNAMNNAIADFTRFTVYEKDDPNKTNLLVNGDFKMGLYGWFNTSLSAATANEYNFLGGFKEGTTSGFTGNRAVINVFDAAAKNVFKSKINVADKDKLAYLNNTYYNLTSLKKLNISYIGGSVTNGYGSTDTATKSWAALTTAWFKEKFPDAEINSDNVAIGGTGSYFGTFRYEDDVQSNSPDLVFIEFAINDFYDKATKEQTIRNIESIIQNAYTRNANVDIVLVGIMDKWRQYDYDNLLAMKELAQKYNIMMIDIMSEFKSYLATTSTEYETYFKEGDGVHPNDTGYSVYAKIVTDTLASDIILTEAQDVSLKKHSIPVTKLSSTDLMLDAQLLKADKIDFETNNGFTLETKTFSTLGYRNYNKRYVASAIGSTATFKFVGTDIGLLYAGKNNGGKLECSVDGGTPVVIDTYLASANPKTVVIAENLENKEHTLTIKVLSDKNESSTGTNAEIGAILLNGTLPINPENEYMVHNMGTSANAEFGQIVELKPNTEYNYSLYYKNISGDSYPAVWYIKDGQTAYTKFSSTTYDNIVKGETNGDGVYYDAHYTFSLPADAKIEGGVAKVLIGYDSGSLGSDCYYYGFKLVEGNSSENLLTNTNFKKGLYGWSSVGYNYIPDSTETASVTLKKDARLVKFDSLDFFKLTSIDGEIMMHITGEMDYSHVTQFIKLEPNKTYRFQVRKKIILEASCKPYVWFKHDGKTEKNAWKAITLDPIETDIDTLTYLYEFTVPSNATVDDDGKVTGKVGFSTGSKGADVYYAQPKLWAADDATQTNLFENADFKKGFKGWRIGGLGSEVLIEKNGVLEVNGAELLAFNESLFINDTTDNMFNDGDWYSKFGPDETYDDFIKRIYKLVDKKIPDLNSTKKDNPFINVSTDMTSPDTGVSHNVETVAVTGVAILSLISLAFIYTRVRKIKKA